MIVLQRLVERKATGLTTEGTEVHRGKADKDSAFRVFL